MQFGLGFYPGCWSPDKGRGVRFRIVLRGTGPRPPETMSRAAEG